MLRGTHYTRYCALGPQGVWHAWGRWEGRDGDTPHLKVSVATEMFSLCMHTVWLCSPNCISVQAANVLLRSCESDDRGVTAKISDFGLSFKMDPSQTHVSRMCCGTLAYLSPEVLLDGHKSKAADV